jgi:16S rRNA (guanine527-N7)-methyltransferase
LTDELLRWNSRRNLTAIIDRDEVLEKHIADSLTLLPFARQAAHLLDIGSGAGFPCIPLKIVCPELKVVSVDAVGKKVDFQRHVVRTLGLTGFTALHERAEKLTNYLAAFDLITARALCPLADLAELAGPLLAPGGRLVAMKGPEGCFEFIEHQEALQQRGWSGVSHNLELPVSGAARCLIELAR